ncbi:MAG: hypothetical protein NZ954_00235 [Thermofilaceae archaeon]|nr:hypothetical protein [Thermofilaceae archaeon]MCX8180392.1 hypothetical protein [Thermofilaceae archaeon]MDW8003927.1 hypothetical protein [Thermofilaceae archaeon]
MNETLLELYDDNELEKIIKTLNNNEINLSNKIILKIFSKDKVKTIERLRDFLISNINKSIIVYVVEGGQREA